MGNLHSVAKAFQKVGASVAITSSPEDVLKSEILVLPGVGAFRAAMDELRSRNLIEPILEHISQDKPFLGICLGLQLLFDTSEEDGPVDGLSILPGSVMRFSDDLTVPHMGWNQLTQVKECPLFKSIPNNAYFYFVHSYYVSPSDSGCIVGETEYGLSFASAVSWNNAFAVQFHPEKSQNYGILMLKNFLDFAQDI